MLARKMLRDMKLHKAQFISIFLMAFLGVFVYAGVNAEWYGLQKTINRYYTDTNLADYWIYGTNFTAEMEAKVRALTHVNDTERRLVLSGNASLKGSPDVTLQFISDNKISTSQTIAGEMFQQGEAGVWHDARFAAAHTLKVGDQITLQAQGIKLEQTIRGLVMNPEYVYAVSAKDKVLPDHTAYGYAILSRDLLPENLRSAYTQMLLKTDGKDNPQVEKDLEQYISDDCNLLLSRKEQPSYLMFDNEILQHKTMGAIFPLAFLAIAMLTILTTMTRIISSQRTQIGILKAVGFRRKRILYHYVSYGFWLSFSGAVAGTVIAPAILPPLFFSINRSTYVIPEWKAAISPSIIWMGVACVILCTLTTYSACRSILKETPSQSLRPKAPAMIKQTSLLKRSNSYQIPVMAAIWKTLGFNAQWNIRDLLRSKLRSFMAITGVAGSIMLLVCALGLKDSIKDVIEWQYHEIYRFETKLYLDEEITGKQRQEVQKNYDGIELQEGNIEIKANGKKQQGELLVLDDNPLISNTNVNREAIKLPPNGVSISNKMAELLELEAGDVITWNIYGDAKRCTSKIAEIYRSPLRQGITMSSETYKRLGYTMIPTAVLTSQSVQYPPAGVVSLQSIDDLIANCGQLLKMVDTMVIVLIVAAVILAVVVLYNLGVLSFTERERELATLKVIGFKTSKIKKLLLFQNILLTFIGIVPGIPLGHLLMNAVLNTMPDNFDMMVHVSAGSYLLSIAGTIVVSAFVCLLFSKRIKTLDMVSSLKGVE